jgi:HEAT repeat protein
MKETPASSSLAQSDRLTLEQAKKLAARGAAGVPELLSLLSTKSWAVRRALVTELALLGTAAVEPLYATLIADRTNESRLAAVVDALVGSVAPVEAFARELLDSTEPPLVCDGLQILGRRRDRASVPKMIALTAHTDDNVAVASIEALGRIGGLEAVACLCELVASPSFFRSFPAIDVLGRLGDASAVLPLVAVLNDPLRGAEAARALGRLGDETALPALVTVLSSGSEATLRVAAQALSEIHARSLQRFGTSAPLERALLRAPRSSVLESRLTRALASADPSEQAALSQLLGFFSAGDAVESLFGLLEESPEVSRVAASSLGRLARAGHLDVLEAVRNASSRQREVMIPELAGMSDAVPVLIECLNDPEARVRVLACDALARTGDAGAVAALFAQLGEADLGVSQAAAAALSALGSAETESRALAAAASELPALRRAGLRLLAYFGYAAALPSLIEAARDPDERTREIGISGLPLYEDAAALELLLESSRHASARTRSAAVRALGQLRASAAGLPRLRDATNDPDPWVRYYACQALGKAAAEDAAAVLTARIDDSAGQVRVAAVDALARLSGPPALETLGRAARHEDVDVRRAALTGIGVAKNRALVPLLIEALESADAATRLVAISSLARYASDVELALVAKAAKHDPDANVQNAAIELLADSPAAIATETLIELLSVDEQRARALEALARRAPQRLPLLAVSLRQATSAVAEGLAALIARLPVETSEGVLLESLRSPNPSARRAAARTLGLLYESERVATELARAASSDADPEVRRLCAARLS